jgi:hypothetical protein
MHCMWVSWLAAVVKSAIEAHIPGGAAGWLFTAPGGCSGAAAVVRLHAGVWCWLPQGPLTADAETCICAALRSLCIQSFALLEWRVSVQ